MSRITSTQYPVFLVVIAMVSICGACASTSRTERLPPEHTTYPRDRIVERNVTMVLTPPLAVRMRANAGGLGSRITEVLAQPSSEYTRTIEGDNAVQLARILPEPGQSAAPEALRALITPRGDAVCEHGFRVMHSQYFLPHEATSAFLGIPTPWLQVRYRCSVLQRRDLTDRESDFATAVAGIDDWIFFDIHRHSFPVASDVVAEALRQTIGNRGLELIQETREGNATLLATNSIRRGTWGFPTYERVVAIIYDDGESSELVFQLYLSYPSAAESPDISGLQRYNYHGNTPLARDDAYEAAEQFLGMVAEALQNILLVSD